jgi:hypothetical protein
LVGHSSDCSDGGVSAAIGDCSDDGISAAMAALACGNGGVVAAVQLLL